MDRWRKFDFEQAKSLLQKTDSIMFESTSVECPECNSLSVRFYYHQWELATNRGAIWIWCGSCRFWTSQGNIGLQGDIVYEDPFTGMKMEEFGFPEKKMNLPERLNHLWEQGQIPKVAIRHSNKLKR